MRRVVVMAAVAGFVMALLTGSVWYYLYNHGLSETNAARIFAKFIRYVWPTVILMMDADHLDFGTVSLFLLSSIANAGIYAIVACGIFGAWRRIFRAHGSMST